MDLEELGLGFNLDELLEEEEAKVGTQGSESASAADGVEGFYAMLFGVRMLALRAKKVDNRARLYMLDVPLAPSVKVGLHPASCTLHPAPCTPRLTPCALRPAPCALHPAPCTLRSAPCILQPEPCSLHPAPCTLHLAPCTLHPAP